MTRQPLSLQNVTLLLAASCLAGAALAAPPACRVEPFAQTDGAAAERALLQPCGGEHLDWRLETPRARPADPGPSLLRARIDTSVSEPLAPALRGTVRMSWAGVRDESDGELRTRRAELAAGSLLRLDDQFAVQMGVGLDVAGEGRNRTTLSGLWQPSASSVLYTEWAGSAGATQQQRFGARWWLAPRRMALDIGASLMPDGQWTEQRIGLSMKLP